MEYINTKVEHDNNLINKIRLFYASFVHIALAKLGKRGLN